MHEEPVEILVQLAERGEIDPWNIDIVEVTDRFLSELERRRELDLRISGRTLFFAATLLRMKSEYLTTDPFEDEGEDDLDGSEEDEEILECAADETEPIEQLEREIQRRIGRKKVRRRPVTLYELITELKAAEKEERRRHRRRAQQQEIPPPHVSEVVAVAHDEDYGGAAGAVLGCYESLAPGGETVTVRALCDSLGKRTIDVYIPLLFLTLEGEVALWQEEYFGDVYVRRDLHGQSRDA
ncbi:segregation and condensation protein A [Methanofollis sp. W23]|uniref:segregation and condensation protein A n=1 Tax=Methanofollis sp. W23 TaxID=2817849 RepID=UPI001AE1B830|nr:ScpA family protein [Methanofollis sp. W23]MBP2147066.1 segregation and condensation protein A [Methanofollis sp. W23]